MAPVLGYWNIRGLAQPIRLLLKHAEVTFEDKLYAYGPAPDYSREAWLKEKHTLGLDFPNLPYYIDGDVKLTQSIAIMRYLARKYKLEPSESDRARADLVEQQAHDLRMNFARLCYNPEFETLKEEYLKNVRATLKGFSDFLGKQDFFVSADKLTYVDFVVYEALDIHKILSPSCLDDFQNLKDFLQRIEDLPNIKKYMEADDFIKFQINGDMAYFGSRSHPV